MRVMLSGNALAGPWTAKMLGDYGAEIIKIETPKVGDSSRQGPRHPSGICPKWDSMARNMKSIEINLNFDKYPDAKEVFVDLCKQCDVWINNIPGIHKHGASNELALEANPKLVILQTTGFGQEANGGDPDMLGRTCLDTVGQAFSGMAAMNGMPDGPYLPAAPIANDIATAMMGVIGVMVAYTYAQKTGKGQVVDNSMYEAGAAFNNFHWATQLNNCGGEYQRGGALNATYRPFGNYECGDGEWVAMGCFGAPMWKRLINLLGKDETVYTFDKGCVLSSGDPEMLKEVDDLWQAWLKAHTAVEVEKILNEHKIPCSKIMKAVDCVKHPHWVARNDFITLIDKTNGTEITDIRSLPHFSVSKIDHSKYEGAPILGEHTDVILGQILGYSDDKIEALKKTEAVCATLITR